MKISVKWLNKFVSIPIIEKFENVVVGKVTDVKPHPKAEKLKIAMVDTGKKTLQIVCGGTNLEKGQFVAVAVPGAILPGNIKIETVNIREIESYGMICAKEELRLGEGMPKEIMVLETNAKPGTPLEKALNLKGYTPEEIQKLFTIHTAEVEGVERTDQDILLEIDNKSLTHRPDLWSHYGIAREFAAILGTPLKPYEKAVKLVSEENFTKDRPLKIIVEDPKICPRFTACIVTGVKIEESPQWLKRDLIAVGIRPVNNVVDVTNHIMMGLGQPMHAFDRAIVGNSLIIKRAKQGEKFETLDHKVRTLESEDVIITNEQETLGLAGVMGGKKSEISDTTTEIIFEAGNWDSTLIRKTSTRYTLRTDAVQRFEKALDPNLTKIAIRRACALLKEICPTAKIASALIDIKNYKEKKVLVTVSIERIQKKIGTPIKPTEMVKILERLAFKAKKVGNNLKVEVPSFRATKDISIEDDITEEISRMYGYEKIPSVLPTLPIKLPHENRERKLKHKARKILSFGLGFTEVYNYSFYSLRDLENTLLAEDPHLKLDNYLSAEQTHLRISLVPNILKNIQQNLRFFDTFKIYEIGHTYQEVHEYFPQEEKWICGAVVSKIASQKENIFFQAKGALEKFLEVFGSKKYDKKEAKPYCPYAHPKKILTYEYEEADEFARVFELHPIVAKNFELEETKVALFEINLQKIIAQGMKEKKYRPIPRFPGITIDISVLVNKNKPVESIEKVIHENNLVAEVELFDLYTGKNIEENKKAVAFKVLLQAEDRTLTDEEMKEVQQKIFKELQEAGGIIRGLNQNHI